MTEEITNLIEEKNYKIVFYPHIILQKFINEFKVKSDRTILASFKDYDVQDLLKEAEILVTDYSSVAFDLAYMKKKTIYFQFDLEKYREEQYQDGYYSYETDGFGPLYKNYKELKESMLKYLDDKKVLNAYNKRISNFFDKIDKNNCERIYEEIVKL